MSIARQIKRAAYRRVGKDWPAKPVFRINDDGGYSVLRPTKGWAHFTARRLGAIEKTRHLKGIA